MRLEGGKLVQHADMSEVAKHWCNDMVVDHRGRAYVGCTGAIPLADMEITPAPLLVVDPDGQARVAADDLMFPNGVAVTADNRRLYVAESGACRLTRFDVAENGDLFHRTPHAQLTTPPDGVAMDANDELWVADPLGFAVLHLAADGSVAQRLDMNGLTPLACALGGDDGDLLMVCLVPEMQHTADIPANSWIEVFKVGSQAPR
jgi:sugar lactone lactonase YvrE